MAQEESNRPLAVEIGFDVIFVAGRSPNNSVFALSNNPPLLHNRVHSRVAFSGSKKEEFWET